MTRQTIAEKTAQEEAREKCREMFPPGTTVSTVLRHVSRSGMMRSISVLAVEDGQAYDASYWVARAIDEKIDQKNGGIRISGAGMDMGWHLVYRLSNALYCPDKYDHDAAYSLKQRWV